MARIQVVKVVDEDVEALRQSGWTDRQILEATVVAAQFNFINRIVDALGAELEPVAKEWVFDPMRDNRSRVMSLGKAGVPRRSHTRWLMVLGLTLGLGLFVQGRVSAQKPFPQTFHVEEAWLQATPVPADPELEAQILEVQETLIAIHRETISRTEGLKRTQDPATRATLFDGLEHLQQARDDLGSLLHDLVEEAKASEWTVIDEALERDRLFEMREERQELREELIRDRQE